MKRAQGSLEYLLILAAILAIAVVIILIANSLLGTPEEANIINEDKYEFAVMGWEVMGYDTIFDCNDTDSAPAEFIKGNETYSPYNTGQIPQKSIEIGDIIDVNGVEHLVYISANGFYIDCDQGFVPPSYGDGICDPGEDYLSCPEDCCEADCTDMNDLVCHAECTPYCTGFVTECDGINTGEEICSSATETIQCCTGTAQLCGINTLFCDSYCSGNQLCEYALHIVDCVKKCSAGVCQECTPDCGTETCADCLVNEHCEGGVCVVDCIDGDSDTYYGYDAVNCPTGTDCDDANASIWPGQIEICDGVDNDCDGSYDEDFDSDTDTYTTCGTLTTDGSTVLPDCDDGDPLINPGATENCTDTTDNDCDGDVDCDDSDCLFDPACACSSEALYETLVTRHQANAETSQGLNCISPALVTFEIRLSHDGSLQQDAKTDYLRLYVNYTDGTWMGLQYDRCLDADLPCIGQGLPLVYSGHPVVRDYVLSGIENKSVDYFWYNWLAWHGTGTTHTVDGGNVLI